MYLKSAFNYTGQKYQILEQIYKHFPKQEMFDVFVDLFCGGGSVFINCDYKKIIANDIIKPLINFYNEMLQIQDFDIIKQNILKYKIDKNDKDMYNSYRDMFNNTGADNPYLFFCLIQSCTNNMMRFNKSFKFNQTFGYRSYNDNTEIKLLNYFNRIKSQQIKFTNNNYTILLDKLLNSDKKLFIYLDPPYLITEAGYNSYWSNSLETDLYKYIDKINDNGHLFMLSNVSHHKGIENPNMKFLEKFNIIEIENNYKKVSRSLNNDSQEIIVKNY